MNFQPIAYRACVDDDVTNSGHSLKRKRGGHTKPAPSRGSLPGPRPRTYTRCTLTAAQPIPRSTSSAALPGCARGLARWVGWRGRQHGGRGSRAPSSAAPVLRWGWRRSEACHVELFRGSKIISGSGAKTAESRGKGPAFLELKTIVPRQPHCGAGGVLAVC